MVDRRITRTISIERDTARLLSKATYHQLVLALREIVANSSDANAARIEIKADLKSPGTGTISILDFGDGMSRIQFDNSFLKIGATTKAPLGDGQPRYNKYGRKIIGRFGIGFIASVPFAGEIVVETKTSGDSHVHGVRIASRDILEGIGKGDHAKFIFPGWEKPPAPGDPPSFTRVTLSGLTKQAYDTIDASLTGGGYQFRSDRKARQTTENRIEFLKDWLSRILPLGYQGATPNSKLQSALDKLLPEGYRPATISFNGKPIKRNLADAVDVGEVFTLKGEGWEARGVLWSPLEPIKPPRLRGIAVRSGDMAIGYPAYANLGAIGRVFGKLQHIAGEVQVEGLDEHLQLDRQGFYPTASSDHFLEQLQQKISGFDTRLQKKAKVVEEYRKLGRAVKADTKGQPSVSRVLRVDSLLQKLERDALSVGVSVEKKKGEGLDVPQGERRVTVGDDLARRLLSVKAGGKRITVKYADSDTLHDALSLAALIQESSGMQLTLHGEHPMFRGEARSLETIRFLATLKIAHHGGIINSEQLIAILRILDETYR